MMHMGGEDGDPIGILLAASMVRDDMPWFYEIARDVYQTLKTEILKLLNAKFNVFTE